MINKDTLELIREFFNSNRPEREEILQQNLTKTINDLAHRRMLHSSDAMNRLGKLFSDELKARAEIAWGYIQKKFERQNLSFSIGELDQIKGEIKDLVNAEMKRLSGKIQSRLSMMNKMNYMKSIDNNLASARNQILSKLNAELKLFESSNLKPPQLSTQVEKPPYVDEQRINDLKSVTSPKFDLSRLIRLCEEINLSHQNDCYMSIAMAVRAILDHIPPLFGFTTFSQVASNYGGAKSFKDSMNNLENSLRKVADAHLHVKIRNRETLPTFSQVSFIPDLDVMLSEIIRILK